MGFMAISDQFFTTAPLKALRNRWMPKGQKPEEKNDDEHEGEISR